MSTANRLNDDIRARYFEDGVVCLEGVVDQAMIESLRAGITRNRKSPSERGRVWDRDAEGRTCFYDSHVWRETPEYRDFIFNSPLAELVGRVMGSSRINFFFDAVFVRTPGNQFRTPFHQDEPYWSVVGFDTMSVWMPLVPVAKKSALEFVRGSHRWDQTYKQVNFGSLTGDHRDTVKFDDDAIAFPDIEGQRDSYDIMSWDMEPGDVALFNARMIHGGSGNLEAGVGLEVFNTQWLGDDVRVKFRAEGMDPDHSAIMTEAGLQPGDRIGTDLYPEVWPRPTSAA